MKDLSLTQMSMKARLWTFAGALLLLIGYLGWRLYSQHYLVFQEESVRLDDQIDVKKAKQRQILAQKQRIKDLEVEIEQANVEFVRLKEMFPDEEAIPKRLIDLTTVTRRSLTVPTRFMPLRVEEKEFYRENHYAITISSSYHSLGLLLGEVANFKYPTAISKMQIERNSELDKEIQDAKDHGETPRTIVANFELTTFTSKK